MIISGMQKLTLLDYPGKTAAIIFTYGCNFRCPFCHNALLVTGECTDTLSEEEVFAFLEKRKGILDAVCITGGEPTLQKDLKQFILKVRSLGYSVKLDTNGTAPDVLEELLAENLLDYVAMDIKNTPEKYSLTAGADVDINNILKSMEIIKNKAPDYEFRTTVTRELHTEADISAVAELVGRGSKYFLQQFKDSGCLISGGHTAWDVNELHSINKRLLSLSFSTAIRES
ncbi:MAG: anaerobic ribonucleoside-triphosphate reductase activating protein [Clostridia bacterium]|nr:anaerobic ribonucleoside-triphosphate reductase activating protein [Clostridia bacterium]